VSYTPINTFSLRYTAYAPGVVYDFSLTAGVLEGTLEGISGALEGRFVSAVNYTPSSVFAFDSASYRPDKVFLFSDIESLSSGEISGTLDGIGGGLFGAVPNDGVLVGELNGISGAFVAVTGHNLGVMSGVLSGLSGELIAEYDVNVTRWLVADCCAPAEDASRAIANVSLASDQASFSALDLCAPSTDAARLLPEVRMPVGANTPRPIEACSVVDQAQPASCATCASFDVMDRLDKLQCSVTDRATPRFSDLMALLDQLIKLRPAASHYPVEDAGQSSRTVHEIIPAYRLPTYAFPPANYSPVATFDFIDNPGYEPSALYPEMDLIESVQRGVIRMGTCGGWQVAALDKLHQCYTVQEARRPPPGTSIPIDPPPPPPPPPPEGHETLVIPTQSSYTMQHVISVVTLVGNVAVPVSKVNLALNADAFAWQFSAILSDPGALSLVEIVDNEPVKLKITIDGYIWHTIVEEIEPTREFGKQAITLKGRGLSALLGAPYEQPKSTAYGSDLTVQQLADMQLPVGWTLDWTQVTWLVPANAWSYTNQAPIQALAGIANDTGSMLVPARDGQSLTMMPRYPYWPWDFAGATPDLVIPEAAIKSLSLRSRLGTQANGVYVHGGDVGGVLGWCRFNGTDGARLAETRSNNLMTDVIGCRALGSRILAGQYTQPIVKSLTTYLDGDVFPLAEIGMLAAITIGAETERGIINSVAIEATLAAVSQTIQIGEETPNVWALFKELLPRDPLLVGTLASTDGSTSIITLLDGGVITVRGTGTVGNKYYIRAGRIEGDAPTMTQNEIVV
jgi:hypothetical protein